jgi:hypothetical protein
MNSRALANNQSQLGHEEQMKMRREQQQKSSQRRPEPQTVPAAPVPERECVEERVRQLQAQQTLFAEAARQLREKGMVSTTPEEASTKLKLGEQVGGE